MLKKIKYWFRNIFVFSKTETNASILMILLMIIMFIIPLVLKKIDISKPDESYADHEILNSMIAEWEESQKEKPVTQPPVLAEYYPFDPNVVPKETLKSFGIEDKVAERIINYRNKGGKFYVKADLLKIYDFPPEKYQELFAYVLLPEKKAESLKIAPKDKANNDYTRKKIDNFTAEFDINTADTNQLKAIKGIGSVLSTRIIKYRDNLGGFISKDQLNEVYGLDDQVLLQLKSKAIISSDFEPQKIDINNADVKQLKTHPYISKKLAERIVSYRNHHGNFSKERKLDDIRELDDQIKEQIYPYLNY